MSSHDKGPDPISHKPHLANPSAAKTIRSYPTDTDSFPTVYLPMTPSIRPAPPAGDTASPASISHLLSRIAGVVLCPGRRRRSRSAIR